MKDAVAKDNLKRATPLSGRSSGGKERKQRKPERHPAADQEPQSERFAAGADNIAVDEDMEAIFALEEPQQPFNESEQTPPDYAGPMPGLTPTGGNLPQHQGMGRWFMGVALCVAGSGYVAWHVVDDAIFPRAASIPDTTQIAEPADAPVVRGETIHKLPQAAVPSPPPEPQPMPSASPRQQPAVAAPSVLPPLPKPQLPPSASPPLMPATVKPAIPPPLPPEDVRAAPAAPEPAAPPVSGAATGGPASAINAEPAASLQVLRDCSQCPELVVIPSGQFSMGSPADEPGHQQHEAPQHAVAINAPFAIGRFEVTFAEWDLCVNEGGCRNRPDDEGWGRSRMPAINVSWSDIVEDFLPWLARKSGKPYRLPSEAEWEYAARASSGLAHNVAYGLAGAPSGLCGFANAADDAEQGSAAGWKNIDCRDGFANTAPVGSFKPNPWGLHDLAGNVWEWVEDCWNETYGAAPSDGSAWTSGDCGLRVVRGGSWSSDAEKLRAADRGWNRPDGRSPSIGFRVARKL